MNIRFNIGKLNISLTKNGVRLGGKIGDAYISKQIVKKEKKNE